MRTLFGMHSHLGALTTAVRATLVAVALAVLTMLVIDAGPAEATFPGQNGKIAYESSGEIYTIDPDASGKFKVTNNNTEDVNPSYSPDGKKIAYVNHPTTDSEIWTIKPDGGGRQQVTDNSTHEFDPTFSPDGKRIAYTGWKAFSSSDDDLFDAEIYKMKAGGGGKVQVTNDNLTHDTVTATNPSWGSRP